MEIGKKGYKFEVVFNREQFKKNDVLKMSPQYSNVTVKVISTPKPHYKKWGWRILNVLTFGFLFNVKYTYTVKIISDDQNND